MLNLKLQYFVHLMRRTDSFEMTLMLGRTEGKRRKWAAEDEMVGQLHQLNGYELEQTPGDSEGQGKPGALLCMEWPRVGHDLVTNKNKMCTMTHLICAIYYMPIIHK